MINSSYLVQYNCSPTPLVVAWVFRWTFSSSPTPHLQLCVSLRYRKCRGERGSLTVYAILFKNIYGVHY